MFLLAVSRIQSCTSLPSFFKLKPSTWLITYPSPVLAFCKHSTFTGTHTVWIYRPWEISVLDHSPQSQAATSAIRALSIVLFTSGNSGGSSHCPRPPFYQRLKVAKPRGAVFLLSPTWQGYVKLANTLPLGQGWMAGIQAANFQELLCESLKINLIKRRQNSGIKVEKSNASDSGRETQ